MYSLFDVSIELLLIWLSKPTLVLIKRKFLGGLFGGQLVL